MKRSRFTLLGTGVVVSILATLGLQSFTAKQTTTYWYRSSTGSIKSVNHSTPDCSGANAQCTITTTTSGVPVIHLLWRNNQLTVPADKV